LPFAAPNCWAKPPRPSALSIERITLSVQPVNASFAAATIALDQVATELGRWATWHWVRTAIGVGAFALAVLGVRAGAKGG